MTAAPPATPRPWRTGIGRFGLGSLAAAAPNLLLAEVYPDNRSNRIFAERHEDAALIVRAVNAHDALVAALDNLVKAMERHPAPKGFCEWTTAEHDAVAQARSALEAARG